MCVGAAFAAMHSGKLLFPQHKSAADVCDALLSYDTSSRFDTEVWSDEAESHTETSARVVCADPAD